jgi:hypothetical protein
LPKENSWTPIHVWFHANYICWTKHGERCIIIEEDEEEEGDDDNMIFCGFAEYGAFDDTAMGEAE